MSWMKEVLQWITDNKVPIEDCRQWGADGKKEDDTIAAAAFMGMTRASTPESPQFDSPAVSRRECASVAGVAFVRGWHRGRAALLAEQRAADLPP